MKRLAKFAGILFLWVVVLSIENSVSSSATKDQHAIPTAKGSIIAEVSPKEDKSERMLGPSVTSPYFHQQISPKVKENLPSVEEAFATLSTSKSMGGSSPSILKGEDLKDTHIPSSGRSLNIKDILNELQDHIAMINCESPESMTKEETGSRDRNYDLCNSNLVGDILSPLGQIDSSISKIFNHLESTIYRPLGLKITPNRYSYSDTLSDLLSLDETTQTIHKDMPMPSASEFKKQMMERFAQIQDASNDFDVNKDLISSQIIDILKDFHIFWNYHRQKSQMPLTQSSTMSIVKQLIGQFTESSDSMRVTTLNILENIKEAYFRFMKAHKMNEYFKEHPSETVAFHIVNRFKDVLRQIKERKIEPVSFVEEFAVFLDLLRGFHIINYKFGKSESESLSEFEKSISDEMLKVFNVYLKFMDEKDDPQVAQLTDFSAILILKMRQRNHIIFNKYQIQNYVLQPSNALISSFTKAAKLYYSLMDELMLIPTDCNELSEEDLEECIQTKFDLSLQKLGEEYMLHTSISGVNLYKFIKRALDDITEGIAKQDLYKEFMTFRNEYFVRLFSFSEHFRQEFQIKDMRAVSELESEIGFQIEKAKAIGLSSSEDSIYVDKLDKQLYDFFLNVKNDFNKYAPVTRDVRVVNEIVEKLKSLIGEFFRSLKGRREEAFKPLLLLIIREGQFWVKKHSVKYVVNSHSSNYDPQLLKVIEVNDPSSDTETEFSNQPLLNGNSMAPVSEQASDFLANNPFIGSLADDSEVTSSNQNLKIRL
jgi:hypothetical protein